MRFHVLAYRAAAFAALVAIAGCPATPTGEAINLDELSPPPSTTPADTNPTARAATLTDLSAVLMAGAVPNTVTTSSSGGVVYIGEYVSGSLGGSTGDATGGSDTVVTGSGGSGGGGGGGGGGDGGGGGGGGGGSGGGTTPPSDGGGSGGSAVGQFRGARQYHASLTGTRFESLGEYGSLTQPATENIRIGLNDSGQLATVFIPGFVFFPDILANVTNVGDTVEFAGSYPIGGLNAEFTLAVTLQYAIYSENGVSATIGIELYSIGGALIQEGTGVQTLNASWDTNTMTYSSHTAYDMVFRPAAGTPNEWWFEPVQIFDFSGTLVR